MGTNRRSFLHYSLLVLGSAVAGKAASKSASGSEAPAASAPVGPPVPVLTPDHQVMHMHNMATMPSASSLRKRAASMPMAPRAIP